jgi:FkbM family methyltransferase
MPPLTKERLARHLRRLVGAVRTLRSRRDDRPARPASPPVAFSAARLADGLERLRVPAHAYPGFDLVVRDDPGPFDKLLMAQRPYSEIALLLNRILDGDGTLIDLGANVGTVAMAVAAAGSAVLAVELLPGNCLRLTNAALANGFGKVRIVQAAASSADGLLEYAGDEAWGTVSKGSGRLAVALRVDTIVSDCVRENPSFLRPPFAMKIDVEGHEHEALLGSQAFVDAFRPVVVFECIEFEDAAERNRRTKGFLAERGYRLFLVKGDLLVPKEPSDIQEELVGDFLAVPAEGIGPVMTRLDGYARRQPTAEERVDWLETLVRETDEHRRHAARVAEALSRQDPVFAELSGRLRAELADRNVRS